MISDEKPPETAPGPAEEETPEVYAVKRGKDGFVLSRRSFLGAVAVAVVAAESVRGCQARRKALSSRQPSCGDIPAHGESVDGLLMIDETLFSWSRNSLKAWNLPGGALVKTLLKDSDKYFNLNDDLFPPLLGRFEPGIGQQAFAADGKTLASLDSPIITVWSFQDGEMAKIQTLSYPGYMIDSVALSADGKTLAVGREIGLIEIRKMGDDAADEPQQTHHIERGLNSLAIPSAGELLLCGTLFGTLLFLSLADGQVLKTIKLGNDPVSIMATTLGGDLALVRSLTDLVLVSLPEGEERGRLSLSPASCSSASVSSDGRRLAAGTWTGGIYLWNLETLAFLGCLFDPYLAEIGTKVSQGRVLGAEKATAPCDDPLPAGAACLCDCVAAARTYETTNTVCVCDTISAQGGLKGDNFVCTCHTVRVGNRPRVESTCGCVSNVSNSGSHYWRPN